MSKPDEFWGTYFYFVWGSLWLFFWYGILFSRKEMHVFYLSFRYTQCRFLFCMRIIVIVLLIRNSFFKKRNARLLSLISLHAMQACCPLLDDLFSEVWTDLGVHRSASAKNMMMAYSLTSIPAYWWVYVDVPLSKFAGAGFACHVGTSSLIKCEQWLIFLFVRQ